MIRMKQKLIKIGSSTGVTLPAKQLEQLGSVAGDSVSVNFDESTGSFHVKPSSSGDRNPGVDPKLLDWANGFNDRYGDALNELSDK